MYDGVCCKLIKQRRVPQNHLEDFICCCSLMATDLCLVCVSHTPLPPHSLLTTPSGSAVEDYLLPKALTTSNVKPSLSLIKTLSGPREWLAEVIYVLRPLAYVSLLVADKNSREKSNRALMVALFMELMSRNLRRTPSPSAVLERAEYAKRDKDMVWYLLRGTIWDNYTRPKLESFVSKTSHAPLVGLLGALVKDWIPLIDEYYYYTAP